MGEIGMTGPEKNVLLITGVLAAVVVLVIAGVVLDLPGTLGLNLFEETEEDSGDNIETYLNQNPIETVEEVELEETEELEEVELEETENETLETSLSILINDGDEETEDREVELLLKAEGIYRCKVWDERGDYYTADWFNFEDTEMDMDWKLTSAGGNKEVFFQCKNKNDILTEIVSDEIYYDKDYPSGSGGHSSGGSSEDTPESVPKDPYDLVLDLNGEYTLTREINISFSVENADACEIYEEDGMGKAVLCNAQYIEDFVLTEGDELKTVYFRANKGNGDWVTISKEIILIENEPIKPKVNLRVDGGPYITFVFSTNNENIPYTIDHFELYRKTGNPPDETEPRRRISPENTFTKIADVDSILYIDTDVIEGQLYTYYIQSVDLIGRESPRSNYKSYTAVGDAPTVELISPEDSETRYGMTFAAYSIDDDISTSLDITVILDGIEYAQGYKQVNPMLNYVSSLDLDNEGAHTLQIKAIDYAGQIGYSEEIDFKWYESEDDNTNEPINTEDTNHEVLHRRTNTNDPGPGDVTPDPEPEPEPEIQKTIKEISPKTNAV